MARIKVLADNVANKIAAGEVVERPASVVKELLENSLDAEATRLRVDVEVGGKRLMRVSDDGAGMVRDDALLAFDRHATSKLRQARDLLSISTLGFRGEALPSIASVSRLLLETRSEDEPTGTSVEIAGGRMLSVEEAAMPRGTTITVRDLFYSVPARRKFLRTEKTELAHIASLVTHYSLAHIDKSFQLAHERGELLNATPVGSLRERVFQVFGSSTLEQLVELGPIERELEVAASPAPPTQAAARNRAGIDRPQTHVFALRGFVSAPQVQKLNRNSIYIFVNRRLIRDRVLLRAISSAYHNLMPPGHFPFALLFLELPFEEVDVNVHPSKTEVRFRHQGFVHDLVRDSIRDCLIASKPASALPLPADARRIPPSPPQPATEVPFSESSLLLSRDDAPPAQSWGLQKAPPPTARLDFAVAAPIEVAAAGAAKAPGAAGGSVEAIGPGAGPTQASAPRDLAPPLQTVAVEDRPHARAPLVDTQPETLANLGQLRPLGQVKESFIVAAGADGLWIIDQHVAHERILFERVLRQRAADRVESQRLLMPIIMNLQPDQEIKFTQIEEEFRANGFELEPFGHRTVAVKAAPAALSPHQVETLIHEILDTPEKELRELSLSDLQRRVAATIACHAAIKVNMPLDGPKMQWLLDELAKTDCPMSCPHGRPIALKYGLREILKAFHRI